MRQDRERLIGEAPEFLKLLEAASLAAPLDKPVLIVGERGTGKELSLIHISEPTRPY